MVEEGHAVGLHCDVHVRHDARDEAWLRRDVASALARLAAVGVRPRLWRTPWGVLAPWTPRVAAEHGLRIVSWSVDTHDWRGDEAGEMLGRIRSRLVSGAIVLAHDAVGPGALREGCGETVELVARIAQIADASGLRLVALADAAAEGERAATPVASPLARGMTRARRTASTPGEDLADVAEKIAAGAAARERPAVPSFRRKRSHCSSGPARWRRGRRRCRAPGCGVRARARAPGLRSRRRGRADLDGHLNALERLAVQARTGCASANWTRRRARGWRRRVGSGPSAGGGDPAAVVERLAARTARREGLLLRRRRAAACARARRDARGGADGGGRRWLPGSTSRTVTVSRSTRRGSAAYGLRASVSHRVSSTTRRCRGPRRSWRAVRAAVVRARRAAHGRDAGPASPTAQRAAALAELAARPGRGQLEGLAAGRIATALGTIDLWIERAARRWMRHWPTKTAIERCARLGARARGIAGLPQLLDEAARACGSRPFATGSPLDRARRDLELFLLQHRLDPLIARAGEGAPGARDRPMTRSASTRGTLRADSDPWDYATSEYEQAKYAATLQACGRVVGHELELGGSIGVFSARSPRAASASTRSTRRRPRSPPPANGSHSSGGARALGSIRTICRRVRSISSLPPRSCTTSTASDRAHAAAARGRLAPGGTVVAVHWRPTGPERR